MSRRRRVIINTDAKNEADDQYAIVHALLSPSLDIRGVIPAHFGQRPGRSLRSMEDSRVEVDLLLKYLGMQDQVRVENGAPFPMPAVNIPVPSPGAELIIEEALRDDAEGPLYVAFFGPLTDMASALLMEPRIAERDIIVVWIGGPGYDADPFPGPEFNLSNDVVAANMVFRSTLTVWQVPRSAYATTAVGYAELDEKVAPCGPLGRYLVDQLVEWNERFANDPMEYRALGDSPAVAVIINPSAGQYIERPAMGFNYDCTYDSTAQYRPIRVYQTIDSRFMLEDFFAKLHQFARSQFTVSGAPQLP
ncbi:UNVERIFIED_ORG: inosine-uridine nucleoside N-ribohydrolase [Microbispora rosea subsp. rosea]